MSLFGDNIPAINTERTMETKGVVTPKPAIATRNQITW